MWREIVLDIFRYLPPRWTTGKGLDAHWHPPIQASSEVHKMDKVELRYGPKIFSMPRSSFKQYVSAKFSNRNLKKAASDVFGSARISQAETELFVTSYDTQFRRPVYFTRTKAQEDKDKDFEMKEIAMSTSAAPTIFPAYHLDPGNRWLVDGGVAANNPACLGFAHAKRLWPGEDVMLLSIGTGVISKPLLGLKKT